MEFEKIAFDENFSLNFGSSSQKRIYGVCCESFENDTLKNQIHYEVEVNFLNENFSRDRIFEINRKQFYINNTTPGSKIEQIAEKASQTIFPLRIKIKKNGEIDEILPSADAIKRWFSAKEDILNYHKGEATAKIIHKIEAVLLNNNLLKESICQNWFFHLYFKPLYVAYTSKLSFKFIWKSPFFGYQFIEYGVFHTIKEHYDKDGKIHINATGSAIDDRTIEEIMEGYSFPKKHLSQETFETVDSTMNVDYKLYKEDRSIFSITGTFETKINENTQRKIQAEIYHLPEKSSFRPWSDAAFKENLSIFQSFQKFDDDDPIIDIAAVSRKRKPEEIQPLKILGSPHKPIQLYIPDEDLDPVTKTGFWNKLKSIFKKIK